MTDATKKLDVSPMEVAVSTLFPILRGQWLLWEICELSFRLELLQLDSVLLPALEIVDGTSPSDIKIAQDKHFSKRQELACKCFDLGTGGTWDYLSTDRSRADKGLASPDWDRCFPYVKALWDFMSEWDFEKPRSWKLVEQQRLDAYSGRPWEVDIARAYAQNYYNSYGRPAVLPQTLTRASLNELLPPIVESFPLIED